MKYRQFLSKDLFLKRKHKLRIYKIHRTKLPVSKNDHALQTKWRLLLLEEDVWRKNKRQLRRKYILTMWNVWTKQITLQTKTTDGFSSVSAAQNTQFHTYNSLFLYVHFGWQSKVLQRSRDILTPCWKQNQTLQFLKKNLENLSYFQLHLMNLVFTLIGILTALL